MKYKRRIERLNARQRTFDNIPKAIQESYTRPGSLNK